MEALINSFRRGRKHVQMHHIIMSVEGYDTKEKAEELVGKKVTWKSASGKEIVGEIKAPHGNSGCVRAIFERGLPGQAIATKVKVE
jgi:large subunit ribosomal protein L35Ae